MLAGQDQRPTFRARTELIRIDVVVVDAEGHVVKGLTEQDFQIFDRGRPRSIGGLSSRIDADVSLAGLAPGGYRLRVSVADGSTTAARGIGFVIR